MMAYEYPHPVSRTYQYKKITKPLLERKRRARINRCLDELKELMVDALETEGENISKLEKADILELTVRHLQRLQASRSLGGLSNLSPNNEEASCENRWKSGFGHCAAEACRFLSVRLPGEAADRLAKHLATGLQTNRQTPNELSSTIANLERTANLVSPSSTSSNTENNNSTICRLSPSLNSESRTEANKNSMGDMSEKVDSLVERAKSKNKISPNYNIDEEEIDVERVDGDPMWRPW
ncbi:enhancer of split mgamma protein-like [Prorops nasuta]|uniref:enhancer of split mgamma protein-like n=1 Tax=Prorops nasuta TaxID=863751 RepID=UPI0034CF51F0